MTASWEETSTRRLELVERLTDAIVLEIAGLDPQASMPWLELPTVRAMVDHLGTVEGWVVDVLHAGGQHVEDRSWTAGPGIDLPTRYAEARDALLRALRTVPADAPCWTIGGGVGTAAFWRRRMVHEHAKHLIDLRAADHAGWQLAPELEPVDYADGVDELLEVFLGRSRRSLPPLPAAVVLAAADTDDRWRIDSDWSVEHADGPSAARVTASAGHLALLLWERADPFAQGAGFVVDGDAEVVHAVCAAPIHPW